MLAHRFSHSHGYSDTDVANDCTKLPQHMWFVVLSFCNRDWFLPVLTDMQMMSVELSAERKLRLELEQKLEESKKGSRIR